MAKLSQKEINEIKAAMKEQADIQAKINSGASDYLSIIKDIKELNRNIASIQEQQSIQEGKASKAKKAYEKALKSTIPLSQDELDILEKQVEAEQTKLGIINSELESIKKRTKMLADEARQVNKYNAMAKMAVNDINGITTSIKKNYAKLSGMFTMDKSIKNSALQMGVLSKQGESFAAGITNAADNTIEFGIGIEKLAEMQASYSEELGRTVTLSRKGLEAMGEMAAATALGAEGAAKMASDMENQGVSASRTRDFVEQTMNDAHKLGLNASKVIKNIANNMKMLNKYNFKGGVKGLAKMAETTTKLGVDMSFAAGMAEKLFDIEGAVDMSAQLQVMGGAWAKLADPFKLMYMARNDMEALTAELGKAAESSVHFNKVNGEFEISALEMHRLRKVAEQTGVSYEELATAGKNAAKYTKIKSQLSINVKDKDMQEFLTSTAQFNEKGEATINIDGEDKLLKSLTEADKSRLKALANEKQALKQRAKDARTFDDTWNNTIMLFKQQLMPIVQSLDTNLKPLMDDFVKWIKGGDLMKAVKMVATGIADALKWVGKVGQWLGPKGTLAALIGGGVLFEAGKWFLNGLALGKGFNTIASAGGAGGVTGGLGKMRGKAGKIAGGIGLAAGAVGIGTSAYENIQDEGLTPGEKFLKTLDQNKGTIIGTIAGAIAGRNVASAGAGSAIGGVIDTMIPTFGNYGKGAHDAIFNSPINDGLIGGSDFNKGRGIIQGGKITPIDNKDDLMAFKPNGPIDKSMKNQSPSSMKIEFGEIHFKFDEIKISSPGSPSVAIDLIKNPEFIRNITRMVHVETSKAISGGVLSPNPRK